MEVASNAITVVSYFNRSTYFFSKLQNEQKNAKGKSCSLALLNDTRWNSHYYCFCSLLNVKRALRVSYFILFF
jgi:hypothetical protein